MSGAEPDIIDHLLHPAPPGHPASSKTAALAEPPSAVASRDRCLAGLGALRAPPGQLPMEPHALSSAEALDGVATPHSAGIHQNSVHEHLSSHEQE
jgi:hypothetical protein